MERTIMVCTTCGSSDVIRDAEARWKSETKDWELSNLCDSTYCNACDDECDVLETVREESQE